ncbi:FadR/GntR family transcriptional regulator [Leucobacter luti]|uniref:GntR family transcriptional regulator n=1 Tax=Leucobacter luti TaxID=340320 RepID=A0A4Q7U6G7_9MICO|nr:FadR/GntR family transcriptional regulator [Leucobacter luti]MBL3700631.1 FadR family transcriptional regulator [Leucobacter luti]RZT68530.1 GntR family transcriptional regulator [Leucobacter luti]
MALDPVQQRSLSDQVVERLRTEIVEGRWRVGERIPPEPELMADLGVARGTLREALRALQYSGMLEIRRGDGTFVRARSEVPGALARSAGSLRDVLEARSTLEPQLARFAAERADAADTDRIAAALSARAAAADDEWVAADVAVHEAIARAAHSPILFEVYTALLPLLHESMRAAQTHDGFCRDERRGHDDVLAAIHARDPEAAAASAAANLSATEAWHAELPPR